MSDFAIFSNPWYHLSVQICLNRVTRVLMIDQLRRTSDGWCLPRLHCVGCYPIYKYRKSYITTVCSLISLIEAGMMKRTKNDAEDDVAREQKIPKFFVYESAFHRLSLEVTARSRSFIRDCIKYSRIWRFFLAYVHCQAQTD